MIITVTNGKGGVGNTATAVSLAHYYSFQAATTLFDLDPQADATKSFGADPSLDAATFLDGGFYKTVQSRIDLNLLSGNGQTEAVEDILKARLRINPNALTLSANALRSADYSTYKVIDTAKKGLIREVAVKAADIIVVPTTLDYNACSNTLVMVDAILHIMREDATVVILPQMLDGRRSRINSDAIAMLKNGCEDINVRIYKPGIPNAAALENAGWDGKTVFESSDCKDLSAAYSDFAKWILEVAR